MKAKINKSDFSFLPAGHGHYKVTFTSPVTGKQWTVITHDMTLIDRVKNEEKPLKINMITLKHLCKIMGDLTGRNKNNNL